jgi:hypothetical protein
VIRELAGRGFHRRAALACFMALLLAALLGYRRPVAALAATSQMFSQVEPIHMSMCEFLDAAIRLDPYCAEASHRFAAEFPTASGASAWHPVVGFRASPSTLEAWAAAEGLRGASWRITYGSGDINSDDSYQMATWRGVVEAPLSCISQVIQPNSAGSGEAKLRAAELRVAQEEARAVVRAIDMLRRAEALAMQGDAAGAMQAYGELSLLIGLPSCEIRPVVITGDGPARLAELIERALDADPAVLMHEWLTHDPDLIEAEARLAEAGSAGSLLDAITLSAGFEWDQSWGCPRWQVGASIAVGANMVGKSSRPAGAHEHTAFLQRRVDALKAHSTARFIGALGHVRSVWAELPRLSEPGDQGAAQVDARRIAETAGIAFLAGLGVFVWKSW